MLSILIPVYNYKITTLVVEIHKQATKANIKFEIICFDDKSEKHISENKSIIDTFEHTKIILSNKNIGRTNARQILSDNSNYNWLLFLDADVIPKSGNLIEHYIDKTNSYYEAIYGGLAYSKTKPEHKSILRWLYGKTYEEVDAKKRNLKPHQLIASGNFIIKKTVFNKINLQIDRKGYGLDNYFAALLKQNNIKVLHVNNEVYHFGIENSIAYLSKVEGGIITLLWLFNKKKISKSDNKLLTMFVFFKKLKLNYLMIFFYQLFNSKMKKHLLGPNPNIGLLQFYKLTYICYKDLNSK